MFEDIKTKFANFITGGAVRHMKETIDNLSLRIEDADWNLITGQTSDRDFSFKNLRDIRRRSWIYWLRYPMVKQMVRLTTEFVFGNGVPKPTSDNDTIQDVIDETWKNKQNQKEMFSYEAQVSKSNQLLVDGELFLVLFVDPDVQMLEVASLDPDEITTVITDPNNKHKPLYYKRTYTSRIYNYNTGVYDNGQPKTLYYKDWENEDEEIPPNLKEADIAKGVVYHIKINSLRSHRGIPDTYIILDWAKSHKVMCEDLATWTKAIATFAWKKKLKKGGKAIIDAMKATYNAKRDQSNPAPATASTLIENEFIENKAMEFKTGSTDWEKNIRQMVLAVAAGSGYGEQYFGNPATANLAIGEKLELPLLKKVGGTQKLWEQIYLSIFMYAIGKQIAITESNKIKAANDKEEEIIIDIDFPPIKDVEVHKYIESVQITKQMRGITDHEMRVKSLTALGCNNIDKIVKQLEEEDEKRPEPVSFVPGQVPGQGQGAFEAGINVALAMIDKKISEVENKK